MQILETGHLKMFVNGWGGLKLSSTLAFSLQVFWIIMALFMMGKLSAGSQSAIYALIHQLQLEKSYGNHCRESARVSYNLYTLSVS